MPSLSEIISIKRGEHVTIIGMNGSGKTFLAEHLLRYQQGGILVLDTKGTLGWRGYRVVKGNATRAIAIAKGGGRVIFRPPWEWGKAQYDMFFSVLMKDKKPLILYVDEIFGVANQHTAPNSPLGAIRTRGREFGITLWASTQFPRRVPLFLLSEARHFFVFYMSLPAYEKMISEIVETHLPIRSLGEYEFYYKQIRQPPQGPYKMGKEPSGTAKNKRLAAV